MIQNLTHVNITQASLELMSYDVLENLAKILQYELDETSTLNGSIKLDYAYKDTADSLMERFSDLSIEYTNRLLRFTNNQPLLTWMLEHADSNNDGAIGINEIGAVETMTASSNISNLAESEEYSNVLTLMPLLKSFKGGASLNGNIDVASNNNITSIDLSTTATKNINGLTNKTLLTSVKYNAPTEIKISGCSNLTI